MLLLLCIILAVVILLVTRVMIVIEKLDEILTPKSKVYDFAPQYNGLQKKNGSRHLNDVTQGTQLT